MHGWPIPSLINQAHAHGTKVVLVATLFDSNDLITLLSNHSYKQNLINNLIAQVQLGNADGVNIDFESLPVSQRDNMIDFIQNLVASHFNLNIQELLSQRRSRSLARPRQIAMYLAKHHTTNSLPDIGRKFSNRDHTTVIHAVKKIDELIKKDNDIRQSVEELKKKLL